MILGPKNGQGINLKCDFGIDYGTSPKVSANLSFGFGIGPKPK